MSLSDEEKWHRKPWMTDGQWRCVKVLAASVGGFHHLSWHGPIKPFGSGIESNTTRSLSTYDGDELTRLVILAHDQCVRLEIGSSGPGRVRLMLSPRKDRVGSPMFERHPTLETHMESLRKQMDHHFNEPGSGPSTGDLATT